MKIEGIQALSVSSGHFVPPPASFRVKGVVRLNVNKMLFIYLFWFFRIIESRHQSCELNPNKIESTTEACANAEFLLQVLDDITESIFMSSEACPRTLR